MRFGQNPLKASKIDVQPPSEVTVGVLNYIPEQTGYFRDQFDSLKLCLASLRANSNRPFDLLVVDNGSCPEVRNYLVSELEAGRICYLILNQRNIGKSNAQSQILHSAHGDFVFYSDGDIYYRPGWMQAHLDILKTFPEAGMVGGIPLRDQANYHTAFTRHWAEQNQAALAIERGNLIPEEWTREFLHSIGEEQFIENWIHDEDWRVTCDGVSAYVGASHMQFLISRRVIENIAFHRSSHALFSPDDQRLDDSIEEKGYLRLSVSWPCVYHIGNRISEEWLVEEYHRLVDRTQFTNSLSQGVDINVKKKPHWFWGRWRIRRILKSLYDRVFKIYYENS